MPLPDTANRDGDGRLRIGGCDVVDLAGRYGTPLYVYDEATIRARLRAYLAALSRWPAGGDVLYSAKAYLGAAMVGLLVEEGCGVDVVSGGELAIALRCGMAAARIGFCGSNKDAAELALAARAGIGHLVVESLHELDLCAALSVAAPLPALLRVSPGVAPVTHRHIATGQLDSKFGLSVTGGSALAGLRRALEIRTLRVTGVQMHIGSQVVDMAATAAAIGVLVGLLAEARDTLGFVASEVSVGGGLGIAHTSADSAPAIGVFMTMMTDTVRRAFGEAGLPLPALHVEPGRSVVGTAGVAVYRTGARKEIPGVRTYLGIDGGMGDNIRPNLYGAVYEPVAVVDDGSAPRETVTLAGRYCESTDVLAAGVALPPLRPGDLVAVPAAGAYTMSMASNFNATPRPAVVFVAGGRHRLVRRRETVEDLLAAEMDVPPASP